MPRYAAVDIGSNSIRMLAAEVAPGSPPRALASDRQVTRLGESVFRNGSLSAEAIELASTVLARMAAQYRKLDVAAVRAVATSAVRDSRNQAEFLERASLAIGSPVETISGREEAHLIHLGVQSRWPHPGKRLLIIDIGGGSAELIAGVDGAMRDAVSRPVGAVRLREIFLKSDPPAPGDLRHMEELIEEKIAPAVERLGRSAWDRAVATSATASAVICAVNRIPRARRDAADRLRASTAQVRKLYEKLGSLDVAARRKVTGIGPSRAEIIVPGVAVLLHALEAFQMRSVYYSAAGVRDGIIADLAARGAGGDLARLSRDQRKEVEQMTRKFAVPLAHARRVAELASILFAAMQPLHELAPSYGRLLEAAGYLHDVGHYVNDAGHHKHAYYLVANADLSGFTSRERELIANLCRYHRKAMPAATHTGYQSLSAEEKRAVLLLAPLLRLADNLDRSHEQRVETVDCQTKDGQVVLRVKSSGDVDLEQWAAERAGDVFRQVYGKSVSVVKARPE